MVSSGSRTAAGVMLPSGAQAISATSCRPSGSRERSKLAAPAPLITTGSCGFQPGAPRGRTRATAWISWPRRAPPTVISTRSGPSGAAGGAGTAPEVITSTGGAPLVAAPSRLSWLPGSMSVTLPILSSPRPRVCAAGTGTGSGSPGRAALAPRRRAVGCSAAAAPAASSPPACPGAGSAVPGRPSCSRIQPHISRQSHSGQVRPSCSGSTSVRSTSMRRSHSPSSAWRWTKTTAKDAAGCHSDWSAAASLSLLLAWSCHRAICSRVGRGRRLRIARWMSRRSARASARKVVILSSPASTRRCLSWMSGTEFSSSATTGCSASAGCGLDELIFAEPLETAGGKVAVRILAAPAAAQLEPGCDLVDRPAVPHRDRVGRHPDGPLDAQRLAARPVRNLEHARVGEVLRQVEVVARPDRGEADVEAPMTADAPPEPPLELDPEADQERVAPLDDAVVRVGRVYVQDVGVPERLEVALRRQLDPGVSAVPVVFAGPAVAPAGPALRRLGLGAALWLGGAGGRCAGGGRCGCWRGHARSPSRRRWKARPVNGLPSSCGQLLKRTFNRCSSAAY